MNRPPRRSRVRLFPFFLLLSRLLTCALRFRAVTAFPYVLVAVFSDELKDNGGGKDVTFQVRLLLAWVACVRARGRVCGCNAPLPRVHTVLCACECARARAYARACVCVD